LNLEPRKDRGWWLTVEFERKAGGGKRYPEALELLGGAGERYDLIREDGRVVARGNYTPEADMGLLARLLALAGAWKGTAVYVRGREVTPADLAFLVKMLQCAGKDRGCRAAGGREDFACIGCRLPGVRVGLCSYSLAALHAGERYWFSYLKPDPQYGNLFILNRRALEKDVRLAADCPFSPADTAPLLGLLPDRINLGNTSDTEVWVPARLRIRSRWLCRFPPVVPRCENRYNETFERRLRHVAGN
jgi:hypothetical protein